MPMLRGLNFTMNPTKKQKLFIVSGASGVGKSTTCDILFKNEKNYIVLEGDLLWNEIYNTPADDYSEYRTLWMNVAASVSQIGLPVVLCGCAIPKQYEPKNERKLFSDIHYIAIVCSEDSLVAKMKNGRNIHDEKWLKSSIDFNNWLSENAKKTSPEIFLVDNTDLTPEQTAEHIDRHIQNILRNT